MGFYTMGCILLFFHIFLLFCHRPIMTSLFCRLLLFSLDHIEKAIILLQRNVIYFNFYGFLRLVFVARRNPLSASQPTCVDRLSRGRFQLIWLFLLQYRLKNRIKSNIKWTWKDDIYFP